MAYHRLGFQKMISHPGERFWGEFHAILLEVVFLFSRHKSRGSPTLEKLKGLPYCAHIACRSSRSLCSMPSPAEQTKLGVYRLGVYGKSCLSHFGAEDSLWAKWFVTLWSQLPLGAPWSSFVHNILFASNKTHTFHKKTNFTGSSKRQSETTTFRNDRVSGILETLP